MDGRSPEFDPGALLAHSAWMRRLAAALAGTEGEDVVQETWLAVLARSAPLERPRAWLGEVLRNAARMRARGEVRRRIREERAETRESAPAAGELAARAELEQLAVRAVLDLDEPYRSTLLERYVQGLEPVEIARRAGVPASTVRNRLARGLELVRVRMDARHGGERRAWIALLAPLGRDSAPSTTLATTATVAGGVLMSLKWIAGGAALVAALVLAWTRRPGREEQGALAPVATVPEALLADPEEAARPVQASSTGEELVATRTRAELAPADVPLDATTGTLIVRVRWGSASLAAGVLVSILSWDTTDWPDERYSTTDDAGEARFEGLAPGSQHVKTEHGAGDRVDLAAGETEQLELVIPPGMDVDVRVVDAGGNPVAGADICFSNSSGLAVGAVVARTDARGRALVRDVPTEWFELAARADGYAPSNAIPVSGAVGDRIELTLTLPGAGAALEGSVRDREGRPIAGAELSVGRGSATVRMPDGTRASEPPPCEVRTDVEGRYSVRGLAPGIATVSVRAHGFACGSGSVPFVAGETTRHDLVLGRAMRVEGVVRTSAGEPVAGALVRNGEAYLEFGEVRTRSRADGSFVLTSVGHSFHFAASHEVHGRAEVDLTPIAGADDLRWDPMLVSAGRLAGVVLDERGEPLAGWHVTAVEPQSLGLWLRESCTDATGRFELPDCPEQRFVLAVRSPAEVFGDPVLVVDDFELGADDLVLRVPDADRPSAYIEGMLAAADGSHLEQPLLYYVSTDTGTGLNVTLDAERRFRVGPLRPGEYRLAAAAAGMGEMATAPFELAPDATHDAGTLLFEPAARLRVRFVFPEGREPEPVQSQLTLDGSHADSIDCEGGSGTSRPLGSGNYVLSTRSWDWYAPEREVAVAAGETVEVELVLQPATHRSFEFVPPEGDRAERVLLVVSDEHGALVTSYESTHRNPAGRFGMGVGGLLPGVYSFEARASSGLSAAGSFTVLDLSRTDEPLVFPLR